MNQRFLDLDDEPDADKKVWKEFECPSCSAHNPSDEIRVGDEVVCSYCGETFEVEERNGRIKLREA